MKRCDFCFSLTMTDSFTLYQIVRQFIPMFDFEPGHTECSVATAYASRASNFKVMYMVVHRGCLCSKKESTSTRYSGALSFIHLYTHSSIFKSIRANIGRILGSQCSSFNALRYGQADLAIFKGVCVMRYDGSRTGEMFYAILRYQIWWKTILYTNSIIFVMIYLLKSSMLSNQSLSVSAINILIHWSDYWKL